MSNKSPLSQYQTLVSLDQITDDVAQQQAVDLLQQLYVQLHLTNSNKHCLANNQVRGVYLWGKVGRGKTFLMDMFVNSLSGDLFKGTANKICKRQHFHHFMRDVHQQLRELSGKVEPLKRIAKSFSQRYRVLCFDEFLSLT